MTAVKLAITSDLYCGVTPTDRLERLAREMAAFAPDAAILAGDLAEALPDFIRCLKLFRANRDTGALIAAAFLLSSWIW